MEEEKKNNKGLMVGIILFLVICLISIFYFMFKMTYVGNKTTNEKTEQTQTEKEDNNEVLFTELTKYELQEGEEKEVTVSDKKIKLKRKDDKIYLNDNEIGKSDGRNNYEVSVADNLIIFPYSAGQSGDKYKVYNLDGKEIIVNDNGGEDAQYSNIRLKNNRVFIDTGSFGDCYDKTSFCYFFQRLDINCENEKNKELKENQEEYEKHKNDEINRTYEIKYNGQEITIEKANDITTLEKWIETYDKVCLREE